jgi:hypothetical protein
MAKIGCAAILRDAALRAALQDEVEQLRAATEIPFWRML